MQHAQRIGIRVERRRGAEELELRAGTVRIGSAAHCDVRLGPDEAAAEQVCITGHPEGVTVRTLNLQHPVLLDGVPLTEALVRGSAQLTVGGVPLSLKLLPALQIADKAKQTLKQVRQLALLAAVGVGYYVVLHEEPRASALDRSVPAPQLFPTPSAQGCRYREPSMARAYAREQLTAAEVKQERFPYSARDGMLAVPLYDAAYACLGTAADAQEAARVLATRQRLARNLQDDLRAHQLRLEWSLERHRYTAAAQELGGILELVQGRTDEHAQWIAAVAHELRATLN